MSLPRRLRYLILAACLVLLASVLAGCRAPSPEEGAQPGQGKEYLFCFWNTENFFDDVRNGERRKVDKEFDTWFAENPAVFRQKLDNLTKVLAGLNDGRGPDILALAEVETERSAELLRDALNAKIGAKAPPYKAVLYRNPHGGRDIATALITRLPVAAGKTQLLGKRLRILEGHIDVDGHDLVILATHWTSRVFDKNGKGREHYSEQIYGRFLAMYRRNPAVDLLICGDFNDNPDDESVVKYLHATGDRQKVLEGGDRPALYDLFANLWPKVKGERTVGTHFYRGRNYIFDQIVVSPGLLDDSGWTCATDSVRIIKEMANRKGQPLPFGTERERVPLTSRGASDHFPVTVRLRVR
jgi:endonuclease/exonuclease/phosphatase family metal-dependent hydrolase